MIASSGVRTISAPRAASRSYAAMIFSKFPRKSPTVELIWAKPIFMLATQVMRAAASGNPFRELYGAWCA